MDRRRPTFELSQLSWNQGNFEFPQSQIQRIKELIFVLERSKLEQEEEEDQTQTSGYSNMVDNQHFFGIWMRRRTHHLLLWWEKWSLGNARMSKNGDKMIPLLLAYIFWRTPGPPSNQKKREKINELVHKIEQISLCTSRAKQHKLLSSKVFENHRKSRIQQCERSELRLHFEWTNVY